MQIKKYSDLVRLGRNGDGGYVVKDSLVKDTDVLLSFGINDDWSFEKDFIRLSNMHCTCYAYDYSINRVSSFNTTMKEVKYFAGDLLKRKKLNFNRLKIAYLSFIKFLDFNWFFTKHCFFSVGLDSENNGVFRTFKEIIDVNELNFKKIFLKVDIEGMEYNVIRQILNNSDNILGITIEVHDLHKRYEEYEYFIQQIESKFTIYHIHENNYSSIELIRGVPNVIELSFISNKLIEDDKYYQSMSEFPIHNLDQLNDPKGPLIHWHNINLIG
jgi:hypothetical protein